MNKATFSDDDIGMKTIRMAIAAVNQTNSMLTKLSEKTQVTGYNKILPQSYPTTVPHSLFYGPGGCHAKGTGILMYDGSVKKVEDVRIGDKVMGPDSKPREVLRLVRGNEQLYKITLVNGHSFTVDENHVLHLMRTRAGKNKLKKTKGVLGKAIDISVKDYLVRAKARSFREYHKLYQPEKVNFTDSVSLELDPYLLGLLLGDGHFKTHGVEITTSDLEIEQFLLDYCLDNNFYLHGRESEKSSCGTYAIWSSEGQRQHKILNAIKELGLQNTRSHNKFIPSKYKTSSYDSRLQLLAGLMDSYDEVLYLEGINLL
jgi:type IV secretion system protein VirB4